MGVFLHFKIPYIRAVVQYYMNGIAVMSNVIHHTVYVVLSIHGVAHRGADRDPIRVNDVC